MARVKRGTKRRARRKKYAKRTKGFFLTKSKLYQSMQEAANRADRYAYRDRRNKQAAVSPAVDSAHRRRRASERAFLQPVDARAQGWRRRDRPQGAGRPGGARRRRHSRRSPRRPRRQPLERLKRRPKHAQKRKPRARSMADDPTTKTLTELGYRGAGGRRAPFGEVLARVRPGDAPFRADEAALGGTARRMARPQVRRAHADYRELAEDRHAGAASGRGPAA